MYIGTWKSVSLFKARLTLRCSHFQRWHRSCRTIQVPEGVIVVEVGNWYPGGKRGRGAGSGVVDGRGRGRPLGRAGADAQP